MKVYICRHGQTEFNRDGKTQGWADSPLTIQGVTQAWMLKNWLQQEEKVSFLRVYSSDLGRALATARILAGEKALVYGTPGMREICFGLLDGQEKSAFEGVDWDRDYAKYQGESHEQAIVRAWKTLIGLIGREVQMEDEPEAMLVVTHGAILYAIYQILDKDPNQEWPETPWLQNCEVLQCELKDGQLVLQKNWHPEL